MNRDYGATELPLQVYSVEYRRRTSCPDFNLHPMLDVSEFPGSVIIWRIMPTRRTHGATTVPPWSLRQFNKPAVQPWLSVGCSEVNQRPLSVTVWYFNFWVRVAYVRKRYNGATTEPLRSPRQFVVVQNCSSRCNAMKQDGVFTDARSTI